MGSHSIRAENDIGRGHDALTIDVMFSVTTLGPGGTEGYVEDLATALAKRGIKVAVVADSEPMARKASLEGAGVPVYSLGIQGRISRRDYEAKINRFLDSHKVRLIHSNMWLRETWLQDIARARDIPYVATRHSTLPPVRLRDRLGINRSPFELYRNRIILARGNAGSICISDTSLRNFRQRYGSRPRAARVYCGRPALSALAHPGNGGKAPRIIWLGTMTKRKRPLLAIRAFRAFSPKFPGATLFMTGLGGLSSVARREAEDLAGRVTFLGHVDSVDEYLAGSAILLQTSANEGTPRAVLEAMAAGLPVVATSAGATKEMVLDGVTGILVPVDDQPAIAEALAVLAGSPELRESYGAAARRLFEEKFQFSRMVEETIRAYEELVGFAVARAQEPQSGIREET